MLEKRWEHFPPDFIPRNSTPQLRTLWPSKIGSMNYPSAIQTTWEGGGLEGAGRTTIPGNTLDGTLKLVWDFAPETKRKAKKKEGEGVGVIQENEWKLEELTEAGLTVNGIFWTWKMWRVSQQRRNLPRVSQSELIAPRKESFVWMPRPSSLLCTRWWWQ